MIILLLIFSFILFVAHLRALFVGKLFYKEKVAIAEEIVREGLTGGGVDASKLDSSISTRYLIGVSVHCVLWILELVILAATFVIFPSIITPIVMTLVFILYTALIIHEGTIKVNYSDKDETEIELKKAYKKYTFVDTLYHFTWVLMTIYMMVNIVNL